MPPNKSSKGKNLGRGGRLLTPEPSVEPDAIETKSPIYPTLPSINEDNGNSSLEDDDTSMDEATEENDARPAESEPDPLPQRLITIIQEVCVNSSQVFQEKFLQDTPDYNHCQDFFDNLNKRIEESNQENDADLTEGTIDTKTFLVNIRTFREHAGSCYDKKDIKGCWAAFDSCFSILDGFNKRYHLPESWNLTEG
ncbi:hypothetical protein N7495_001428 [Penicillium taxi]|uniref:uncharacterized protein n=1 Tax=Penicillium taxi TaxID=168475 RepID=UPI0025452792|nr:uncharacterized protein N7495_001428 [Penicillium taxi]KAJ5908746.1 hypothetical protein N7495_001428 [Penicillium taxi]